jgi:hypothetical protein
MSTAGKYLRRCSDRTLVAWCPGCKTQHPFDLNRWQFDGNLEAPTFSPSLLFGLLARTEESNGSNGGN